KVLAEGDLRTLVPLCASAQSVVMDFSYNYRIDEKAGDGWKTCMDESVRKALGLRDGNPAATREQVKVLAAIIAPKRNVRTESRQPALC
ncbi:MAG: hypothetical protein HYV68_03165, partial [Candidatus Taylorbacteria bacterium]|nr:hypothetical protein [Candidatus Taylorbacteria bacterium]